ncbi:MAG: biotin--[acetyl-CoA-carboxylase] ligase [Rhodospirillales bacterium]|jgi:BirA family biotin operon repressor/biotin-[acetyl-CoA-carboxylase] ligase|nr:biotin--[acetyl-CoA-carboxylase] ligase [Rhodospirillales bacterium]MDP6774636.1 biotin--[acetyl-CoA-carboxylase] ligase [Rhodospirillales bacterium]
MSEAPDLPPYYRLVSLDSVDSTNEEAKRLARRGGDTGTDGTVVWARSQTAGRGRRGRTWASPVGNLHCSVLLRPRCPALVAAQLSFAAALAVAEAIAAVAGPGAAVCCKWPNDVLMENRKVAGILLESEAGAGESVHWVVIGVGVNVAHFPEATETPATSLWAEGCTWLSVQQILEAYCTALLSWKERLLDEGFGPVRERWLGLAKGLGEPIEVRLDKEILTGRFAGVDADGALILEGTDGGRHLIGAGDVFFPAA